MEHSILLCGSFLLLRRVFAGISATGDSGCVGIAGGIDGNGGIALIAGGGGILGLVVHGGGGGTAFGGWLLDPAPAPAIDPGPAQASKTPSGAVVGVSHEEDAGVSPDGRVHLFHRPLCPQS